MARFSNGTKVVLCDLLNRNGRLRMMFMIAKVMCDIDQNEPEPCRTVALERGVRLLKILLHT